MAAALPAPADLPQRAPVPPPIAESFAIAVGTFDNERQATLTEARLKAEKLQPYTVDILMAPNDVRRRVLLGRYPKRAEADAALMKLKPAYPAAQVILGWQERFRLLIPNP